MSDRHRHDNTVDVVRLVGDDDAPWADTGTGVLLKVVRFDELHGTWVILNRFHPACSCRPTATPARSTPTPRPGVGTISSTTSTSSAGSYLFEPANSVHTLHVPDDNTGDTDVCFVIEGALLNLAADGSVESVTDGPGIVAAYYALLEPRGPPAQRPHRLTPA